MGVLQAKLIGSALKRNGIKVTKAFSSPAYRSVTTCAAVLEAMEAKDEIPVNVEASLFEWVGWHCHAGPLAVDWLTVGELRSVGINVSKTYVPKVESKEMVKCLNETIPEFQERTGQFIDQIAATIKDGETVLCVAHGPTGYVTHQRLCKTPVLTDVEFQQLMTKIPYSSLLALERDGAGGEWKVMPGVYSVTHQQNKTWNIGILLDSFKGKVNGEK